METLKNTNAMMNGTNPSNMTTMLSLLKAADLHNYLNFDNTRIDILDNGDDPLIQQTDRGFFDTNSYDMHRISCFMSDFGFYITIFTQA